MASKTRTTSDTTRHSVYTVNPADPSLDDIVTRASYRFRCGQYTLSENSGFLTLSKERKSKITRDVGTNFLTYKTEYEDNSKIYSGTVYYGGAQRTYNGPLFAKYTGFDESPSGSFNPSGLSIFASNSEMDAKGTTAIARTIPTNPVAGLATVVGELKEGLPSIPGKIILKKSATGSPSKGAAGEYLNYQFGLKPLISDVRKIATSISDGNKIIEQYERDSGRNIRRRYKFPIEVLEDTETVTTGSRAIPRPGLNTYLYASSSSGAVLKEHTRITREWSFSGCYTYHLSRDKTLVERMRKQEQLANKLLGTRITPGVLWELTPWSWLIDWKSNLGDVMTNLSAFSADGLVMRYGYIMCTTTKVVTVNSTGTRLTNGSSTGPLRQTFTYTLKQRRKATPFGFGLDSGAFTMRQWAILGALGISKAPGRL